MRKLTFFLFITIFIFGSELNYKSLKSDFTQIVNSNDQSVTYIGEFHANSDNNALWIYKSPIPKRIYFSNSHIVIIEDELEQAIISKLDNTPNLTQILNTAKKISENLYKATFEDTDYLITLKNGLPLTIDYKDKLDNKIKITLKNTVKNELISNELLTPKIPKEYDIITQ